MTDIENALITLNRYIHQVGSTGVEYWTVEDRDIMQKCLKIITKKLIEKEEKN